MADFDSSLPQAGELSDGRSKRRARRDSLFLLANVISEAGQSLGKVKVRNLSGTGLQAEAEMLAVAVGDRIVVELRGVGAVPGNIAWVRAGRIGMVFDREIDPQAVRKPINGAAKDDLPVYLRPLPRVMRFNG